MTTLSHISHEEHLARVRLQYDGPDGSHFYPTVMGGDGLDVHYGVYESDDDSIAKACARSTELLLQLAPDSILDRSRPSLLDLGSGNGGPAHHLLELIPELRVECVNLCEIQNALNRRRGLGLGFAERLEVHTMSFDQLPDRWSDRFDIVWSQEALCHALDKRAVLGESWRVLKPGGVFLFTDIMLDNAVADQDARSFTDRNVVSDLATPAQYVNWLTDIGFQDASFHDWSHQLESNFQRMRQRIEECGEELIRQGVSAEYLEQFSQSLGARVQKAREGVFAWGAFVAHRSP